MHKKVGQKEQDGKNGTIKLGVKKDLTANSSSQSQRVHFSCSIPPMKSPLPSPWLVGFSQYKGG